MRCYKPSFPIRSKSLYILKDRIVFWYVLIVYNLGMQQSDSRHQIIVFALSLATEYVNSANLNLSLHPIYFSNNSALCEPFLNGRK